MDMILTPDLKDKVSAFYNEIFNKLTDSAGIKSYDQFMSLWTDLHLMHIEAAEAVLHKYIENLTADDKLRLVEKIEAQSIVVEVIDQETGKLFRRNLPVKYLETDNGIIMSGETSDGIPSHIAFLSDIALKRINDLVGKGPDTHTCED